MPTLLGETRESTGRLLTQNGQPIYEETRNYIVQADYVGQSRYEILNQTPGLPRLGQFTSGFATCKSVDATRRTEQGLIFDCVAEFSSEVQEGQEGSDERPEQPDTWIPIYELKKERISEQFTKDVDDKRFANSLGDPFEGGISIGRFIPIYDFYQFESASISDDTMLKRNETTNKTAFRGAEPDTLLMYVESVVGRYYGKRLRLNHYTLKYNKENWLLKVADKGSRYLDPGPPARFKPFVVEDEDLGISVPYIGALDGSGDANPGGEPVVLIEFRQFQQIEFNQFLRK